MAGMAFGDKSVDGGFPVLSFFGADVSHQAVGRRIGRGQEERLCEPETEADVPVGCSRKDAAPCNIPVECPQTAPSKQHRSIARQLDVLRRRAIHDVLNTEFRCEIIRSAQFFDIDIRVCVWRLFRDRRGRWKRSRRGLLRRQQQSKKEEGRIYSA